MPDSPQPDHLDCTHLFERLIEHLPGAAALFDLTGRQRELVPMACNHYWRALYPEPPLELWRSLTPSGRYRLLRGLYRGETQFAICLERPDEEWVTLTVLNHPEEVLQRRYLAVQIEPVQHPQFKPLGHNLTIPEVPILELAGIISTVPVMYMRSDDQGRAIACNEALCHRRGVAVTEILQLTLAQIIEAFQIVRLQPPERTGDDFGQWIFDYASQDILLTARNRDGSISTEVWRSRPIRDAQGQDLFCHWVGYDLTQYLQLLQRQQVLNRELMHRVKNNLNTICSLLNLFRYSHPEASGVLETLQQKIFAVSLIHAHLDPLDGDRLLLLPYLRDLLASLDSLTGRRQAITLDSSPPASLAIHPDQGMPVALILQDLLSAWATQAPSEATLQLSLTPAGPNLAIALTWVAPEPQRLLEQCPEPGRQIIVALTRQLQGELREQHDNGHQTLSLVFPRPVDSTP